MTEELINRLSNIRELRVPARTSVFTFTGKAEDIREIWRRLNVEKVLEGSIRKEGSQLRITVQLVNVSDSYHIWSETFDKELTKVFAIQDEIALTIADKLKLELLSDEKERLVKRPTENLEAYNLSLLGHYFFYQSTEESIKKPFATSSRPSPRIQTMLWPMCGRPTDIVFFTLLVISVPMRAIQRPRKQ